MVLTSRQAKQIDSLAEQRFGISVDWLMEAAGWQIARFCDRPTALVCGVGNNAGDGLAAARHLHRWGRLAGVSCVDVHSLRGAAEREAKALRRVGVTIAEAPSFDRAEIVVDAIFGTGLSRAPEGRFADWIERINASERTVIAVDVPSGLDADTGAAYSPCITAAVTVALGLPKPGLVSSEGPRLAGEVWVADIGVPTEAYAVLGIELPPGLFATSDRFRLEVTR
jgi:ADP-dependent NAD(P)H-hydrate dehydratase / NAD(P)H-hydrate epimerase